MAMAVGLPGQGGGRRGVPAQSPLHTLGRSQERVYTTSQLLSALRSGLTAVRDQLQVLTILDGTATSWPGVTAAVDDLEFLVDVSQSTTNRWGPMHKKWGSMCWRGRP
jgi:hypothetical protein